MDRRCLDLNLGPMVMEATTVSSTDQLYLLYLDWMIAIQRYLKLTTTSTNWVPRQPIPLAKEPY